MKKFNQELYIKYDTMAINATVEIMEALGFKHIDTTEVYKDYDIKVDGLKLELEVKEGWTGSEFPFKYVHVPFRKKDSKADIYVMFNNKCSRGIALGMDKIKKCPVVFKNTKYTQNEPFYEINISDFNTFI